MKARHWAGLVMLAAAACGPPPYIRGADVPAEARLADGGKLGWLWELCLDAPGGSAFFTWHAERGGGPFIRLRQAGCDAGADPRGVVRVEETARGVEFLFPAAVLADLEVETRRCPHVISAEAVAGFTAMAEAAVASGRLTPEAIAAARDMAAKLGKVKLERLWLSGGIGNANAWSDRCKDISETIPETNPDFPEELKTGE